MRFLCSVLAASFLLTGVFGCGGARIDISPDFRQHAANGQVSIYPVSIVGTSVSYDPQESARLGEVLRQRHFMDVRLSPQHLDLAATTSTPHGEVLRRAKTAFCKLLRDNMPTTPYCIYAVYIVDANGVPTGACCVGASAYAEVGMTVVLNASDARFTKSPPKDLVELSELLATTICDELGLPPR